MDLQPECVYDDDCRTSEQCHSGSCVDVCALDKCGTNALCEGRNHRRTCTCPPNYRGDPQVACYPGKTLQKLACFEFRLHFQALFLSIQ